MKASKFWKKLKEKEDMIKKSLTRKPEVPAKSFPKFALLPAEIQFMIWRYCPSASRRVVTTPLGKHKQPPSPFLLSCHDAYTEGTNEYQHFSGSSFNPGNSIFNFESDILYLGIELDYQLDMSFDNPTRSLPTDLDVLQLEAWQNVRNVALEFQGWWHLPAYVYFLRKCPKVKQIYFTFHSRSVLRQQ